MNRSLAFLLLSAAELCAAGPDAPLQTPVTARNVDLGAYAEWVDGVERPLLPSSERDKDASPSWILVIEHGMVEGHSGRSFGSSDTPGRRHLRIGFQTAVPVGSVLVRGGGRLSVLKPNAVYPGKMDDDSQWIEARRIVGGRVSTEEVGEEGYALWDLPETVSTRALRFTHLADVADKKYAGWLGGAEVLPVPEANLAPQAMVATSSNVKGAGKLNDERIDGIWQQWANLEMQGGDRPQPVSVADPETLLLVWPGPVRLRGVAALHAGFGTAAVQAYAGPAELHPREAPESAWQTVGSFSGLKNCYPASLGADFLDFGTEVTTRALRLVITGPQAESGHPHMAGHTRDGKRVWLGEWMALAEVPHGLEALILPRAPAPEHPPIPVNFTLPERGWVTLAIEDATGKRVRNLVSDTLFEKGENTAWWDGSDDLGRDLSAAQHGLYLIPTQFVIPGKYRVRGIWHGPVDLRYEMGIYTAGETPWETDAGAGGWLANHTPPSATLFVPNAPGKGPAMLIGSYVSEGTPGLAWVDLDGRKWKGQGWVGGNWTGAPFLARDAGPHPVAGIYAYAAAAWEGSKDAQTGHLTAELRLTGLTAGADKPVAKIPFGPPIAGKDKVAWERQIGGIAAWNGLVAASLTQIDRVLLIDVAAGRTVGEISLPSPRGLAFDGEGRLLALSGKRLARFAPLSDPANPGLPEPLIVSGLEDPAGLALDGKGDIFVSDQGSSHQIEIFSPDGKFLRAFGHPGAPKAGPYDAEHLNHPRGMSFDLDGRLWVAEEDYQPKRVSVWNPDGTLWKAFYGPCEYGGGGAIDAADGSKFYYNGMEFALDWEKGTDRLVSVYYRPGPEALQLAFRSGPPQTALRVNGRRYWTDSYNSNPTGGHGTVFVFADRDGIAVPVAAAGRANEWDVLKGPEFAAVWPAGTSPGANPHSENAAFFLWNDLNGDGKVQPEEVSMRRGAAGSVTVQRDLSLVVSRLEGKAIRWAPKRFTAQGAPVYDLEARETVVEGVQNPPSSGGDEVLVDPSGWSVETTATQPFDAHGLSGAKDGVPQWSYPSLWPGLHASHEAPPPDRPGELIGHTRLLGDFIKPGGETMWMLNQNTGPIAVFTLDGFLVTQLFQDMRLGRPWRMPRAERGMLLNDITPHDENFWPSVTQTPDGAVHLNAGGSSALVRVSGLETVRRIAPIPLEVGPEDLNRAREYFARAEAVRQVAQGRGVLSVALRKEAPAVDGKLDDWSNAAWVEIDRRGTAAYFNSNSKPYDVTGAVAVAGGKLYAAWRTGDKDLLRNSGEIPTAPFKTGGALDLMIGADPAADPKRSEPVRGDERLLVTTIGGKTRALLYRAVVPGTKEPIPFSSPWRTIRFDRVDDVSGSVDLAADGAGNFEIGVPLDLLALKPEAGETLQGDIGILRGAGNTTTQRVYWSNKATNIVADVPSEAELKPALWGRLVFQGAK